MRIFTSENYGENTTPKENKHAHNEDLDTDGMAYPPVLQKVVINTNQLETLQSKLFTLYIYITKVSKNIYLDATEFPYIKDRCKNSTSVERLLTKGNKFFELKYFHHHHHFIYQ